MRKATFEQSVLMIFEALDMTTSMCRISFFIIFFWNENRIVWLLGERGRRLAAGYYLVLFKANMAVEAV